MPYWWEYKLLNFSAVIENGSMNIFYMLLYICASEITMSKEMPIKNGDHYPPKTTVPIYTNTNNMNAHFPKLSLTMDIIFIILTNFALLTFLNICKTFFRC